MVEEKQEEAINFLNVNLKKKISIKTQHFLLGFFLYKDFECLIQLKLHTGWLELCSLSV